RVVGGRDTRPGAWPWTVSIQNPWKIGTGHVCGGSLISPQWVLSAAHCFIRARCPVCSTTSSSHLGTMARAWRLPAQLGRRIGSCHCLLVACSEANDIALLELDQPVQCSPYIQTACVPNASLRVSELTACYVSGWGATAARSRGSSDVLQEARVRLIDVSLCNSSWLYRGTIHPHNLCAGYLQGGIDTCQGDSGGPLVCKGSSADCFWLVGLTSWGEGCARPRRPGVYTSTQDFYDWILVQM
ncbi:ACRO protein, partial [Oreotrochilus melanogaster]|nr:ACRO protein [Oreotrochilus melanogaster]